MKNPLTSIQQKMRNRIPGTLQALADIESEMDRWFNPRTSFGWSTEYNGYDFSPSCDLKETDREYIVEFDIPGVRKEDLTIEVQNNRLTISGERKEEKETQNQKQYLAETYHGSFMRSFHLPAPVDEDKVNAKYEDGVLHLKIPKQEPTKTKKIKVQ